LTSPSSQNAVVRGCLTGGGGAFLRGFGALLTPQKSNQARFSQLFSAVSVVSSALLASWGRRKWAAWHRQSFVAGLRRLSSRRWPRAAADARKTIHARSAVARVTPKRRGWPHGTHTTSFIIRTTPSFTASSGVRQHPSWRRDH
jgi:hypothetical protein